MVVAELQVLMKTHKFDVVREGNTTALLFLHLRKICEASAVGEGSYAKAYLVKERSPEENVYVLKKILIQSSDHLCLEGYARFSRITSN